MSLTDVMSGAGLHLYAEVALVLSAGAFVAVLVRTLRRKNAELFERARWMPLEDDDD